MLQPKTVYKRRLSLGKVDGYGNGQRSCEAEITIELRQGTPVHPKRTVYHTPIDNYIELSICGAVWNHMHTDWLGGGQNHEQLAFYFPHNHKLKRIIEVWKRWHLNGLNGGCGHQRKGKYSDPDASSQVCLHTGYKYGHSWLVELLPQAIIEEVKSW